MLAANETVAPFLLYGCEKSLVWHIWFVNVVNEKQSKIDTKIKQVVLFGQDLNTVWKCFS